MFEEQQNTLEIVVCIGKGVIIYIDRQQFQLVYYFFFLRNLFN